MLLARIVSVKRHFSPAIALDLYLDLCICVLFAMLSIVPAMVLGQEDSARVRGRSIEW